MKKLVRDLIPSIISKEGKSPRTRILDHEEYMHELRRKLDEEIAEADQATSQEELATEIADIYEVLEALVTAHGVTLETVLRIKEEKKALRGGFEKRIFLDDSI